MKSPVCNNSHPLQAIRRSLQEVADPERARNLQRYFKTAPGDYGEGDIFLGIRVPRLRRLAKQYRALQLEQIVALLASPFHEERFIALLLLVDSFTMGDATIRQRIFRLYLRNTSRINNWDLVDLSAPGIVGAYLLDKNRDPLYNLARSNNLWERRIAVLATFYFIKHDDFTDSLALATLLLNDRHDLIHKAVGWMLREIGKRDRRREEEFLRQHYTAMPRTMLRYALEHFPGELRQSYLRGTPPSHGTK